MLSNAFVLFVFVTNYQSSTRVGYNDWQLDPTIAVSTQYILTNQPINNHKRISNKKSVSLNQNAKSTTAIKESHHIVLGLHRGILKPEYPTSIETGTRIPLSKLKNLILKNLVCLPGYIGLIL